MGIGKLLALVALSGCAYLHHAQVGDIDNRANIKKTRFDIKVSETGVNLEEAGKIAKSVGGRAGGEADDILAIVRLFQMGPTTGNPVYNAAYARGLGEELQRACPKGRVTGLMSIRENRKYPVISGEIVKITGYCISKT